MDPRSQRAAGIHRWHRSQPTLGGDHPSAVTGAECEGPRLRAIVAHLPDRHARQAAHHGQPQAAVLAQQRAHPARIHVLDHRRSATVGRAGSSTVPRARRSASASTRDIWMQPNADFIPIASEDADPGPQDLRATGRLHPALAGGSRTAERDQQVADIDDALLRLHRRPDRGRGRAAARRAGDRERSRSRPTASSRGPR